MTRRRVITLIALVAAGAGAAGYAVRRWWVSDSGEGGIGSRADAVLASRLANLSGGMETLEQWRGRVLVVNFWATWCAPCREEIPVFIRMQRKYGIRGLQFVGIAIDRPGPVSAFQRELGMNYPVLLGNIETVELMRSTGNRAGALPYTLVIDRSGRLAHRKLGIIKEGDLEQLITTLL